jgi:vacuolar iron transporter family protein
MIAALASRPAWASRVVLAIGSIGNLESLERRSRLAASAVKNEPPGKVTSVVIRNAKKEESMETTDVIQTLLENWREEVRATAIYSRLARREGRPDRRAILEELAQTEKKHAAQWATQLQSLGAVVPDTQSVILSTGDELSLRFAPLDILIANQEVDERRMSQEHSEPLGRGDLDAIRVAIAHEDSEHADTLASLARQMGAGVAGRAVAQGALDRILQKETWHRQSGGWIGGAIYGVNDGLAAVFGIVSGTAAAFSASNQGSHIVLVAGLAGAIASALSMGCGAYLATKSEAEVHEAHVFGERQELSEDPEGEQRELELMYQLKGLSESESKLLADRISRNPNVMLRTMLHEEMELSEVAVGDPKKSALAAAASTAVGAIIPVMPFFFLTGVSAIATAAVVSIVAHFVVGATKSLVTLRTWWASGLEMTVAGIIVGIATYGAGLLIKLAGG